MKKTLVLICILLTTATVSAQFGRQRQNRFNRQPQAPPSENQKEEMEKKMAERQEEYIANFISTLEADDFQKEIAKQTLSDYFSQIKKFVKVQFDNTAQRKDAFEGFKKEHFKELKTLLSKNDNEKLDEFLEGNFEEKEVEKKKKKRRKKKKKDDEDDN